MKHTKRIQKYLDGNMSPGEQERFRDDLKNDPELLEAFRLYKLIDHTIEHHDELRFRKKLQQFFSHGSENHRMGATAMNSARRNIRKRKVVVVFTVLIMPIVFFLLFSGRSKTPDEIYSTYFSRFSQDIITRSINTDTVDFFSQGIFYYRTNHFGKAVSLFSDVLLTDSANIKARFYRGLSEMEISDFPSAVEDLRFINRQEFSFYQEHSHWYLGLALLKMQLIPAARKEFRLIVRDKTYYADRAAKILRYLPQDK